MVEKLCSLTIECELDLGYDERTFPPQANFPEFGYINSKDWLIRRCLMHRYTLMPSMHKLFSAYFL